MNYWHWSHFHPYFVHRQFIRRCLTKEEKEEIRVRFNEKRINWLNQYKEDLEKELAGVNERLDEITKEKD